MRKTIFPIIAVILFLTITAAPALSKDIRPSATQQTVNVIIGQDGQNFQTTKLLVDEGQGAAFVTKINELKTWFEETRPFKDFQITEDEMTQMKTKINSVLDTLNTLLTSNGKDPVTSEFLYNEMFESEIGRSVIASLGRGYAFIPFYDYETFLGIMVRPMWIMYPPLFLGGGGGYSGNLNMNLLPPRIEYGDRLGPHILRTTMFSGLYVNVGDLGYNNIFAGTILVLGRARVVF